MKLKISLSASYRSDGSDGRVPTYRGSDGAPVSPTPSKGSFAEKRGVKIGSEVTFSGTSMMHERVYGTGIVVGFVVNKLGYSGSGKGRASQDVVIKNSNGKMFNFMEDVNVRLRNVKTVKVS